MCIERLKNLMKKIKYKKAQQHVLKNLEFNLIRECTFVLTYHMYIQDISFIDKIEKLLFFMYLTIDGILSLQNNSPIISFQQYMYT